MITSVMSIPAICQGAFPAAVASNRAENAPTSDSALSPPVKEAAR